MSEHSHLISWSTSGCPIRTASAATLQLSQSSSPCTWSATRLLPFPPTESLFRLRKEKNHVARTSAKLVLYTLYMLVLYTHRVQYTYIYARILIHSCYISILALLSRKPAFSIAAAAGWQLSLANIFCELVSLLHLRSPLSYIRLYIDPRVPRSTPD